MDKLWELGQYIANNWVKIGVALWLVEQGLRAVSELTPWKWDDNIVKVIAKIIKSIFPKKKDEATGS